MFYSFSVGTDFRHQILASIDTVPALKRLRVNVMLYTLEQIFYWYIIIVFVDLCGTPGYLAPEVLKVSMYDDVHGYGRAVDM